MNRRKAFSLTGLLVQIFGFLMTLEAFVWVLETRIIHGKVHAPELHYAVMITGILLLLRVIYIVLKLTRGRKTTIFQSDMAQSYGVEDKANSCELCGKIVSEKVKAYCLNHPRKFQGKIYCYDHQRSVGG